MNPLEPALASTPPSTGLAMQALIASIRNPWFSVRHNIQPSVPPRLHSTPSVSVTHRMRETCHRRVLTHFPFPPIPHELGNGPLWPGLTVSDVTGAVEADLDDLRVPIITKTTFTQRSVIRIYSLLWSHRTTHAHTHTHFSTKVT